MLLKGLTGIMMITTSRKKTITNNVGSEAKEGNRGKRGSRHEAIRNRKDDESNSDDSLNNMNHSNEMIDITGGLYELGFCGEGFCYDNELPEHKVNLNSFRLDKFPVTNGQYIEFIEDGGYENYRYWLADGWEVVQDKSWNE